MIDRTNTCLPAGWHAAEPRGGAAIRPSTLKGDTDDDQLDQT
jgi:hypothetical protein